jgi:hypothetical protein
MTVLDGMIPAPAFRMSRPARGARLRRFAALAALAAAPYLSGCATLAGLPVSPITGAVSGVAHSEAGGLNVLWGYPLGFVAGLLWGPVMAVSIGVSADLGYVEHDAYGQGGNPGFLDVFDPFGYCLVQPPRPEDAKPKP